MTAAPGDAVQQDLAVTPDPRVGEAIGSLSPEMRDRILDLRALILETAAQTEGVGPLEETLKWGQVSYLTTASGSGTTIRIDHDKASRQPALYVNCQTDLLQQYRVLYPHSFAYDGNRGVIVSEGYDRKALQHVIALALTYHRRKRRSA